MAFSFLSILRLSETKSHGDIQRLFIKMPYSIVNDPAALQSHRINVRMFVARLQSKADLLSIRGFIRKFAASTVALRPDRSVSVFWVQL